MSRTLKLVRPLTNLELKFVAEAEAGHFLVGYDAEGAPYAMGADRTYNLFSMEVKEIPEPRRHESVYRLPDDYYEYDFASDALAKSPP